MGSTTSYENFVVEGKSYTYTSGTGVAAVSTLKYALFLGGDTLPATDNSNTLGNSTYRWKSVYAGDVVITDPNDSTATMSVADAIGELQENVGSGGSIASTYVPLAGTSSITGALTPATNGTATAGVSLGTGAKKWQYLYAYSVGSSSYPATNVFANTLGSSTKYVNSAYITTLYATNVGTTAATNLKAATLTIGEITIAGIDKSPEEGNDDYLVTSDGVATALAKYLPLAGGDMTGELGIKKSIHLYDQGDNTIVIPETGRAYVAGQGNSDYKVFEFATDDTPTENSYALMTSGAIYKMMYGGEANPSFDDVVVSGELNTQGIKMGNGYADSIVTAIDSSSSNLSSELPTASAVLSAINKAYTAGDGISIENGTITCTLDTNMWLIVTELPIISDLSENEKGKVYLVRSTAEEGSNLYNEYHVVTDDSGEEVWEAIGSYDLEMDMESISNSEIDAIIAA